MEPMVGGDGEESSLCCVTLERGGEGMFGDVVVGAVGLEYSLTPAPLLFLLCLPLLVTFDASLLPPHTIPLGHPSAPAPSIQYRALNLDWRLISF